MVSTSVSFAAAAVIVCGGAAVAAAAAASASSSSSASSVVLDASGGDPSSLSDLALRIASAAVASSSSLAASSYYVQGRDITEVARVVGSGKLGWVFEEERGGENFQNRWPKGKDVFFFLRPPPFLLAQRKLKKTSLFQPFPRPLFSLSLSTTQHSRRRRRPGRLGLRPRPGVGPPARLPAEGREREPEGGRGEVRVGALRERGELELVGDGFVLSFVFVCLFRFFPPHFSVLSLSLRAYFCNTTLYQRI